MIAGFFVLRDLPKYACFSIILVSNSVSTFSEMNAHQKRHNDLAINMFNH